jgi:carbon-monoxide dehydrogenase medium subunit
LPPRQIRGDHEHPTGSTHDMRYEAPESLDAAVSLLAGAQLGQARILAGGTDLLVQLRAGMIDPELVVDVKKIPEMHQITAEGGGFRIGAAVSGAELGEHAEVKRLWPGVVEAVELIGSTQIQGRATMVGNMCNASPAADSVPALIAAGAIVTVQGPGGRREVPVDEMCIAPGKTSLAQGEIVTSVFLPARLPHSGDAYLRFIPRTEMDIAVVGAGVNLTLDGSGRCIAARVGLGAVAARPLLVTEAGEALIGTSVDQAALERLAAAASAACRPIDDKRGTKAYRTKMAGVMARRAAEIALERARRR